MPLTWRWAALGAIVVAGAGWALTAPTGVDPQDFAGLVGDAEAGASVFHAGGCASCHVAPEGDDPSVLAGGVSLVSDFGTFYAPNISSDPEHGIGGWSLPEFASAMKAGVSPEGRHYYPAFPYTSYVRMTDQDVADLWAYMQTLPADATPSRPHEVAFPFTITRGIGAWKQIYLDEGWAVDVPDDLARGQYLAEALGHCAECHTPRGPLGALDTAAWMAGAPNPSGRGTIPALTPDKLTWSAEDIAYYLETGFTPLFDSAGGSMAKVVGSWSQLSAEDRAAVAAYIKAVPVR